MKLFIQLFFVCCLFTSSAFAQTKPYHFIYIQSEIKEPFFVMMNGVNYSSSPSGYLIVAKLQNGVINFTIGFAKSKYADQTFTCTIADNDLGFSLKLNGNNQWELFDLQKLVTLANAASPMPTIVLANTPTPTATNPTITKIASKVLPDGLSEIYVDNKDTIALLIPNANRPIVLPQNIKNCTIATNDDFLKTRLQMAASATESNMIYGASLAFKNNCFSVEQIKNLSALLLTEENKLLFFLAARKSVYDAQNFASLQAQLTKPNLINQFKKM